MGQEAKKRAEVRHLRKLFGGKMTAEEVHRAVALPNMKCPCGIQASGRAITFAPLSDLSSKDPLRLRWLAEQNGGQLPIVEFRQGKTDDSRAKFVKLGSVYCCDICKPAMEKALAKLPSWVMVHFDYGPEKDKIIVGAA
jgi:hypothetical protein